MLTGEVTNTQQSLNIDITLHSSSQTLEQLLSNSRLSRFTQ